MLQIKNTLGGGKPEGLYVWKKSEISSEPKEINESVSTLPYRFLYGSAVVLNNEIHILGSSTDPTSHYKWNGSSWVSVSTLPYNFYQGSVVVLNGEIHILGGNGIEVKHYKFDGSSWTSVSTLPYNFYQGSAVVLNGEIHILGGSYDSSTYRKHYKFDGSSWTSVSTLPYNFYRGSVVVLNNEIHILGTYGDSAYYNSHYKWDGSSWTSVSTLPYNFFDGSAVVFNNAIHILGGSGINYHYEWDGSSWTSVSTLPYNFSSGGAVVYNNAIHTLGSSNDSAYYKYHYLVYGYVSVYTFFNYVVSDKETAYPDGGEKGGYWYEKVGDLANAFGYTKMAIDYYVATENSNSIKFPHSLGEEPKLAIVLLDYTKGKDITFDSYRRMAMKVVGGGARTNWIKHMIAEFSASNNTSSIYDVSSTSFTPPSGGLTNTYISSGGYYLYVGIPYTIVTFA